MGMLYTQIFETLIHVADLEYHGPLPVPVEVWMDEFANGARPDRFENLITTLRSRNISALIFLAECRSDQKKFYTGDTWGHPDGCLQCIYLFGIRQRIA